MASRPPSVVDSTGKVVVLGNLLGAGGEGAVFDIQSSPKLVAKVYHKPLEPDRAAKIPLMLGLANDALKKLTAWPIDLLRLQGSGTPVGLIVPKVTGGKDIHQLYGPKSRRSEFQRADWRFLIRAAANTARAFGAVHDAGCVIGDVNHGGVLVGQDATVTLIDCDSFQVEVGSNRYLCKVGVETFTPPELQGRSFENAVRTANHDAFGLAVMTFLLLFMGRHPFSGRFLGVGDMPIAKAIEEGRFAYGHRRSALHMVQPPGTPPLSIVGADVSGLFERAFDRNPWVGRPTAREWIAGLTALEGQLKQCTANPSHWHHRDTSCPWCPMEGATGVPLFPSIVQSAAGSTFDLELMWRQVEQLGHPGPAPTIVVPTPSPANEAARLKGWEKKRLVIASTVAFLTFLGSTVFGPVMLLAAVVAFAVAMAATNKAGQAKPFVDAVRAAESRWRTAEEHWKVKAGPVSFDIKRAELSKLREHWSRIPNLRLAKLQELERNREQVQRERFLDGFEIESAKIKGIGKGRSQTLASFGIETAADVKPGAIASVPGFGPKTQAILMQWRADLERRFRFDPTRSIDPRDTARVEQEILAMRKKIESELVIGIAQLRQVHSQIMSTRKHMRAQVETVRSEFLRAQANHAVATS